ncbi:hypothetical protein H072_1704 [Dactylellina haptotyla CBS 200.50]|uniref:Steroid 5-alpha reductase C-terminal domain-containing protein n=1 Tax=Dactylellina haptotyla (strain CBS 200.50) TaxID=1284197 RepID=S8AN16_DACHA|nr:hypothetical protein H072_1704 [Dactylellina haptotyla CBS 200.50]
MATLPSYSQIHDIGQSRPGIFQLVEVAFHNFQDVFNGKRAFQDAYQQTDPLATSILASVILSGLTLIVSEITRNFSQVDRLWSILPAIYIVHYSHWASLNNVHSDRVDTAAVIAVIWSVRLTFNYWRKGGYQWSSEDYRWDVIRAAIGKPAFFIMNITFISFMQNFLLVAITTPVYLFLVVAKNFPQSEVATTADTVFSRGMMLAVILEFFADQQQWSFHQAKQSYKTTSKVPAGYDKAELDRGFLYSGLWAFSRHPNFVGEQLFWVLLYQWSAFVTDSIYNWAGMGALMYLFLFQGSTWLTELITSNKYKDYKIYQKHVSMFLPRVQSIREGGFYFPDQNEEAKKQR